VELARAKIGVERVGIFMLDPSGQYLKGTYGTDDKGTDDDEHQAIESVDLHPELFSPTHGCGTSGRIT